MSSNLTGKDILIFSSLDSTNNFCKQLLGDESVREGTVVWAGEQSKGRGQGSNCWESEKGKNLTISIILHPGFLDPSHQFFLSMIASLAIADMLKEFIKDVFIKWPNDIYTGNKKIAGILIENSLMQNRIDDSILGMGININQNRFSSHLPNPVSLKQLTSRHTNLKVCLDKLCKQTDHWYSLLKQGERAKIRNSYIKQLFRLNELCRYKEKDKFFMAYNRGVDNFGRLVLETEGGHTRYFESGDVEFLL